MSDPVFAALIHRRAELATEVKQTEAALQRLLTDIEHLDATIRQFDPAYRPRRPHSDRPNGAMVKALLAILRKAEGPLTIRDLTARVMVSLGMDCRDRERVGRVTAQVRVALARQRKNGTVVSEAGPNPGPWQAWVWRITG